MSKIYATDHLFILVITKYYISHITTLLLMRTRYLRKPNPPVEGPHFLGVETTQCFDWWIGDFRLENGGVKKSCFKQNYITITI
jgi:hypothetical protein